LSLRFHKLYLSRILETLMAEKFRNRYRVSTTRLWGYDYTTNGAYFITICTKKKIPFFGVINDGKMTLSKTGIIVNNFWLEIQTHFPSTYIDEFIIMPDHLHGIIIKSKFGNKSNLLSVETPNLGVSIQVKSGNPYWKSNSIGSIVNQFKRICTIKAKSLGFELLWQPRFYDHIIRSENELDRIRDYIVSNPENWLNEIDFIPKDFV
jgi:putative transposase